MSTFLPWACDDDGEYVWIRLDVVRDPELRREVASCTCTTEDEFFGLSFLGVQYMVPIEWWAGGLGVAEAHPEDALDNAHAYAAYIVVEKEDAGKDPYPPLVVRPGQGMLPL